MRECTFDKLVKYKVHSLEETTDNYNLELGFSDKPTIDIAIPSASALANTTTRKRVRVDLNDLLNDDNYEHYFQTVSCLSKSERWERPHLQSYVLLKLCEKGLSFVQAYDQRVQISARSSNFRNTRTEWKNEQIKYKNGTSWYVRVEIDKRILVQRNQLETRSKSTNFY